MEKFDLSKWNKILPCIIGVTAVILIAVLLYARTDAAASKGRDINKIEYNKAKNNLLFLDFSDDALQTKEYECFLLEDDYTRFLFGSYNDAHISMWDEGKLDADLYEIYFAKTIMYGQSSFDDLQELHNYLTSITENEDIPETVYISMDPYVLYKNYYDNRYYEVEASTYEEYLEANIFPFFEKYSSVNFKLIFPAISASRLKSEENQLEEIYSIWYSFMMYLRWWDNVSVNFYGNLDWLILNDSNFTEKGQVVDDLARLMNTYIYSDDRFSITPPELTQIFDKSASLANLYVTNKEKYKSLGGRKYVFYGDSLFAYPVQKSASIPSIISCISGAECFDLSVGGTTGSAVDENSFPNVASSGVGLDANRFTEKCKTDDELVFIILYGMNDYLLEIDIQQFALGLFNGAENIIQDYPKAKLLFISPYQCAIVDKEISLESYSTAVKDVAKGYHADFLNLYSESGITVETEHEYLEDGIHPNFSTDYLLAKSIMDKLVSME